MRRFFDGLVLFTRLSGGRTFGRVDSGGFAGAVNFELTGPGGGSWHALLGPDSVRFFRGAHAAPRSTVTIPAAAFADLLAGRSSWMTAQMTGKVRVKGDGHAGLLFGAIVEQFRARAEEPGWKGALARLWRRAVT